MQKKYFLLLCSFSLICSCGKNNSSENVSSSLSDSNSSFDSESIGESDSNSSDEIEIPENKYAKTISNDDIVYIYGYLGEEDFDLTSIDHTSGTNKELTYNIDNDVAIITDNKLSFKNKGVGIITASNSDITYKYVVIVNDSLESKFDYPLDFDLSNYIVRNGKDTNILTTQTSITINASNESEWTRVVYEIPEYLNNDYTIEADLSFLNLKNNDTTRWASIIFKDNETRSIKYPYYHFDIRNNPTLVNGVELTYITNTMSYPYSGSYENGHKLELNEKVHMKIVTIDNKAIGYLNDDKVFEVFLPTRDAGNIGFQAGGADVLFENIKISYANVNNEPVKKIQYSADTKSSIVEVNSVSSAMKPNIIASGSSLDEIWGVGQNVMQLYIKVKKENNILVAYDTQGNALEEDLNSLLTFTKGFYIPNVEVSTFDEFELLNSIFKSLGFIDYTIWSKDANVLKQINSYDSTIRLGYISSATDLSTPDLVSKECIKAGSNNAYLILVNHDLLNKNNVQYFTGRGYSVVADATDGKASSVIDGALDGCSLILTRFNEQMANEVGMLEDNTIFNVDTKNSVYSLFSAPYATGHRGGGNTGTNPDCNEIENTIPSFDWAYANGALSLEIDVHKLNGKLYITHDVPSSTANLPLLEDVFEKYSGEEYYDKTLVIEVKDNLYSTGVEIIEMAKEMNWYGRFILITFDVSTATNLHKYDPAIPVGYLGGVDFKSYDDYWNAYNNFFSQGVILSANQGYVYKDAIMQSNARGQLCWEWTFDNSSSSKLLDNIINGNKCFTTNYIQAMTYNYYKLVADTEITLNKNESYTFTAKAMNYKKELLDIDNPEIILISGNATIKDNTITKLDDSEIKLCLKYKQKWNLSTTISNDFYIYSDVITIK